MHSTAEGTDARVDPAVRPRGIWNAVAPTWQIAQRPRCGLHNARAKTASMDRNEAARTAQPPLFGISRPRNIAQRQLNGGVRQ